MTVRHEHWKTTKHKWNDKQRYIPKQALKKVNQPEKRDQTKKTTEEK